MMGYLDGVRYKRSCCLVVLEVFKWKCSENCKYDCMWPMVEGLVERDWPVPQFHGKVVHGNYQIVQYLFEILTFIIF